MTVSVPSPRSPRRRRPAGRDSGPLLFVLGLVAGLLCALVTERLGRTEADQDIELIRAVRNLAVRDFVSEVEPRGLADDALRGMLEGLDEYSSFYGSEQIARIDRETTGEFRGIGVVFRQPTQEGQVLFPFPDSPAARGGLRVGDRLLEVAGRTVADLEPGGLQEAIQTSEGPRLELLVEGLDGERRALVVEPERIVDPTVRHVRMIPGEQGIGYLAIVSFSHQTPGEFDRAVEELKGHGLERLVVDLRSNPGGILEAAVKIANRFILSGPIVATRTRQGTSVTEAELGEALFSNVPLVLLVDGTSASASEVLAGALQDHCIAPLVGEPTYGKGTVQTLRQLTEQRGIVKLTTAHYYTPSLRRIERGEDAPAGTGLAPELLVENGAAERRRIRAYLRSYSPPLSARAALRSWEEAEGVRLIEEHPADVQLAAAVALLAGRGPESVGDPGAADSQRAH